MVITGQEATEGLCHLEKKLDNQQLDNQHNQPLQTNSYIPESISTDNLKITSELTNTPNLPSVISLDLNTSEGSADELATDYFQKIRNNNQVKDKYKARINKGKKYQNNLRVALKGSTLTYGAL